MMTFYAAAGSYQIRNEDGKDMPYIMRLGKLQPVSIPEFSIWSMLLWDVLTHDELRKKYFEKMEEVKLDPSGFEKALEMLVKRKLIIKGVGYTGADALYNMLYDTYVIPLRGVQGTRRLLNIAKLLKQGKVNFFEAVYLLQPDMVTRMPAMIISIISASLAMMLSWKLSGVSGRESCSWAATQLAKHPTSRSCLTTMLRVLGHPKKTEAKVSQIMSVP